MLLRSPSAACRTLTHHILLHIPLLVSTPHTNRLGPLLSSALSTLWSLPLEPGLLSPSSALILSLLWWMFSAPSLLSSASGGGGSGGPGSSAPQSPSGSYSSSSSASSDDEGMSAPGSPRGGGGGGGGGAGGGAAGGGDPSSSGLNSLSQIIATVGGVGHSAHAGSPHSSSASSSVLHSPSGGKTKGGYRKVIRKDKQKHNESESRRRSRLRGQFMELRVAAKCTHTEHADTPALHPSHHLAPHCLRGRRLTRPPAAAAACGVFRQ